jgi:hypothetical protein
VAVIPSLTADTQAWKEYIPVYADDSATDAWTVNNIGYIPYNYALFNDAAMQLDLTNGAALDPRITFSRTTNATVTGSNGLIQYAPHNLLTFSEQFDNAYWSKSSNAVTVAANSTAAPDGTTTADTLSETTTTNQLYMLSTLASFTSGLAYTFSVFVKAGTVGVIQLTLNGTAFGSSQYANFDVSTGVLGTVSGGEATITASTNGFYRCTYTATCTSSVSAAFGGLIAFCDNSTTAARLPSYAGNAASNVFIWGAQLEVGSTATTYNPTTVKNLLGFTEHFDNAAWTKSNSFVQTNLLLYSEQFDNDAWTKTNLTITENVIAAPDGSLTADKLALVTGSGSCFQPELITAGITYTYSAFLKKDENNFGILRAEWTGAGYDNINFDLENGTTSRVPTGVSSTSITPVGNGWYRCLVTFTPTTNKTTNFQIKSSSEAQTSDSAVLTGTFNGVNGIFIWGAQLVQGTSAGDYKATYAAAAAVGYTDIYGQPFAQKLVENTTSLFHECYHPFTSVTGTSYTGSYYVKAGERRYVQLLGPGIVFAEHANFDLETGQRTAGTPGFGSIQLIGNGWYRVSITAPALSSSSTARWAIAIIPTATSGRASSYTGDGTSGIYIFGAQLSDSASVDPYVYQPVAAPASTAYYGPRFDYDPVTLAPKGLLIEEQRTNLFTYSKDFTNAAWIKTATTVTANSTAAPDGTLTADTLVETTDASSHTVITTATVTAVPYSFSVFLKKGSGTTAPDWMQLYTGGTSASYANFNLATGAVGSSTMTTATMTSVGNGWYRCAVSFTPSAGVVIPALAFTNNTDATTRGPSYTGQTTSNVFVWGAQLEVGAFATSYTPTVASQVTRAADSASMIGNNFARWYTQGAGSLYFQATPLSLTGTTVYFGSVNDGTGANFTGIFKSVSTLGAVTITGGVSQGSMFAGTATTTTASKMAVAYDTNNSVFVVGAATASDTSVTLPAQLTQLSIGSLLPSSAIANSTISRIAYYNRRLANTELTALTS